MKNYIFFNFSHTIVLTLFDYDNDDNYNDDDHDDNRNNDCAERKKIP